MDHYTYAKVLNHKFKNCHFQWGNGFQQITRQWFAGSEISILMKCWRKSVISKFSLRAYSILTIFFLTFEPKSTASSQLWPQNFDKNMTRVVKKINFLGSHFVKWRAEFTHQSSSCPGQVRSPWHSPRPDDLDLLCSPRAWTWRRFFALFRGCQILSSLLHRAHVTLCLTHSAQFLWYHLIWSMRSSAHLDCLLHGEQLFTTSGPTWSQPGGFFTI